MPKNVRQLIEKIIESWKCNHKKKKKKKEEKKWKRMKMKNEK